MCIYILTATISSHCRLLSPLLASLSQLWSSKKLASVIGKVFFPGCPISPPHFLWCKMLQVKFWRGSWLQVRFGLPFVLASSLCVYSFLHTCQWTVQQRAWSWNDGTERWKKVEVHCLHVGAGPGADVRSVFSQRRWIASQPRSFQTAHAFPE